MIALDRYLQTYLPASFLSLDPTKAGDTAQWPESGSWKSLDRIELTLEETNLLIDSLESMPYSGSDLLLEPSIPEFSLLVRTTTPCTMSNVICFKRTVFSQQEHVEQTNGLTTTMIPLLDAFFQTDQHQDNPDAIISIGRIVCDKDGKGFSATYSSPLMQDQLKLSLMRSEEGKPVDMRDQARGVKLMYLAIQYALRHRPTVFSVSTETISVKTTRKHGGKSRRKVKAIRVLRINPTHLTSESQEPRKIGCPCWGVIGHYRTTKSNKQVWVKPHLKGKHRDKPNTYQAKQYVIQTGDMQ